jgi:hypothetical protein
MMNDCRQWNNKVENVQWINKVAEGRGFVQTWGAKFLGGSA